jgi:hypothetical protein
MQARQGRVVGQVQVVGRVGAEGQPPGLQGDELPAGRRPDPRYEAIKPPSLGP